MRRSRSRCAHAVLVDMGGVRRQAGGQAWFGGGCDLTPAYLFDDDATDFHTFWRDLCDRHGAGLYDEYKATGFPSPCLFQVYS